MIKALLFDLDGTLFDRATSVMACVRQQHARFCDELAAIPQDTYIARFLELDCRGYVTKERVYQQLIAELGISGLTCEMLCEDFYAHYHSYAVGFPSLHETLMTLREDELRLGIVSNGRSTFQRATIEALGIGAYFDVILVSEEEGIRKPDAAIFRRALERLRVAPDASIFVGDNPVVDVAGARNVGMRTIWKRDTYWATSCDADWIVDDLASISALMGCGNDS